jgi:hypothetical protein
MYVAHAQRISDRENALSNRRDVSHDVRHPSGNAASQRSFDGDFFWRGLRKKEARVSPFQFSNRRGAETIFGFLASGVNNKNHLDGLRSIN